MRGNELNETRWLNLAEISGVKHKAWGVSPRTVAFELLAREACGSGNNEDQRSQPAVARSRGLVKTHLFVDLGFRCAPPQALRCHPLSRAGWAIHYAKHFFI